MTIPFLKNIFWSEPFLIENSVLFQLHIAYYSHPTN